MNSSPGLTLRRWITQTGVLMNLQGKMSYCTYLPFKPEYLSVQPGLKHMFSNRDAQTGICAAKIKEETGEFGKWRGHMCRYERPYMCERPLNSKLDSSGNTRT